MGSGVFSNRDLGPAKEQRRAAAQAALDETKGHHGSVARIDDGSLQFLAEEISEQMMQELARTWTAFKMGYPTSSKLAALAETIYLQAAVAALDR
jgi:hypothetical protein